MDPLYDPYWGGVQRDHYNYGLARRSTGLTPASVSDTMSDMDMRKRITFRLERTTLRRIKRQLKRGETVSAWVRRVVEEALK